MISVNGKTVAKGTWIWTGSGPSAAEDVYHANDAK